MEISENVISKHVISKEEAFMKYNPTIAYNMVEALNQLLRDPKFKNKCYAIKEEHKAISLHQIQGILTDIKIKYEGTGYAQIPLIDFDNSGPYAKTILKDFKNKGWNLNIYRDHGMSTVDYVIFT